MEFKPDYSSYSYEDLIDAQNHIDAERYPERHEELKKHISAKEKAAEKLQLPENKKHWIASFPGRVFAILIDCLILGILGLLLGLVFESAFVGWGEWGILFGFVISGLYFGIMNSEYLNGQTIGKYLLGIQVVNGNNETISIKKSLLRYLILGIPFFLNGAGSLDSFYVNYLQYAHVLMVFGGILSIVYLYIFNTKTRQSLHDLVVGTYVVNTGIKQEHINPVWKVHFAVIGALFFLAGLAPYVGSLFFDKSDMDKIITVQKSIVTHKAIRKADIQYITSYDLTSDSADNETTNINVMAYIVEGDITNKSLALELLETIGAFYPDTSKYDTIQIHLIYGYDIGIWSKYETATYTHTTNTGTQP